MKKYKITVEGKTYEVEVEEIGGSAPAQAPKAPQAAPVAPAPAPAPKPAPAAPAPKAAAGSGSVTSPMPGTILSIKVKQGDSVSQGQLLMILEAMKMENEILAEASGTVKAIHVNEGASVSTGDPLITIE
jgi:biotin carboxyl carrier protein